MNVTHAWLRPQRQCTGLAASLGARTRVAQSKGYFKAAGVTVDALDPGKGATNVAVSVAGGVYQFGWVDLPSMIRFNAAVPGQQRITLCCAAPGTRCRIRY